DGIRDRNVTGVQTCALPISRHQVQRLHPRGAQQGERAAHRRGRREVPALIPLDPEYGPARTIPHPIMFRVLDAEADDVTLPANLAVEKGAEYAYYPGCIDYYD